MACCVIAAYLISRMFGMLRDWAVFWGLLRPKPGEHAATLLGMLRGTNPTRIQRRSAW